MKKEVNIFVCSECGHTSTKWLGRCPECGLWNSFSEQVQSSKRKGSEKSIQKESLLISMEDVVIDKGFRFTSNISEFDRVLGGCMEDPFS